MAKIGKMLPQISVFLVLCVVLAGCDNRPTASDVEQQVNSPASACPGFKSFSLGGGNGDGENKNFSPENPGLRAYDFQEISGKYDSENERYEMEVSYKLKIIDLENICKNKTLNAFSRNLLNNYARKSSNMALQNDIQLKDGVTIPVEETIMLKSTDSGWIID